MKFCLVMEKSLFFSFHFLWYRMKISSGKLIFSVQGPFVLWLSQNTEINIELVTSHISIRFKNDRFFPRRNLINYIKCIMYTKFDCAYDYLCLQIMASYWFLFWNRIINMHAQLLRRYEKEVKQNITNNEIISELTVRM